MRTRRRCKRVLNGSFCSHATRLLMPNDNGWNGRFEAGMNLQGGFFMLSHDRLTRHALCEMLYRAKLIADGSVIFDPLAQTVRCPGDDTWIEGSYNLWMKTFGDAGVDASSMMVEVAEESPANATNFTAVHASRARKLAGASLESPIMADFRNTGVSPWDPRVPQRRVCKEDRDRRMKKRAKTTAARSYDMMLDLEEKLTARLLADDITLAARFAPAFRGNAMVQGPDGDLIISPLEFAQFLDWARKRKEKRARDAISTEGELLSKPEHLEKVATRDQRAKDKTDKSAAYAKKKKERAKARTKERSKEK